MSRKSPSPKSERILDVAEELFALHGYDGVTLRQIATGAGVDVALASYHFGKKLDLFNAVFERRAGALNESRLSALRKCQESAGDRRAQCRADHRSIFTPTGNRPGNRRQGLDQLSRTDCVYQ